MMLRVRLMLICVIAIMANLPLSEAFRPSISRLLQRELKLVDRDNIYLGETILKYLSDVKSQLTELAEGQALLAEGQAAQKTRLTDISDKLDKLDKWRIAVNPKTEKLGRNLEYGARAFLAESKGSQFVKPLTVRNIFDLAEYCLPSDKPLASESTTNCLVAQERIGLTTMRAEQLVIRAECHIPSAREWIAFSINSTENLVRTKAIKLNSMLKKYDETDDLHKRTFLLYHPLGFQLFTREALVDPMVKGYISELQFDMKGSILCSGLFFSCELVEVKLSGRTEAIDQLLTRFAVLYASHRAVFSKEELLSFSFHFKGVFASDARWENSPNDEAKERISDLGLVLPSEYVSLEYLQVI